MAVTQLTESFLDSVKSDPMMPIFRLRRYLSQYGPRREMLNVEVSRIIAGLQKIRDTFDTRIYGSGPYGWESADFTSMIHRIFRGKQRGLLVVFDELSLVYQQNGSEL